MLEWKHVGLSGACGGTSGRLIIILRFYDFCCYGHEEQTFEHGSYTA